MVTHGICGPGLCHSMSVRYSEFQPGWLGMGDLFPWAVCQITVWQAGILDSHLLSHLQVKGNARKRERIPSPQAAQNTLAKMHELDQWNYFSRPGKEEGIFPRSCPCTWILSCLSTCSLSVRYIEHLGHRQWTAPLCRTERMHTWIILLKEFKGKKLLLVTYSPS